MNSRGDHLWSQLGLLFGDGGAEGAALCDPVRLDRPEQRHAQRINEAIPTKTSVTTRHETITSFKGYNFEKV